MERLLYEASVEGNTTVLQHLLQKDPLILDKVTLIQHDDMPLHVASMLGHKDFVNEILTRKPELSKKCDSQRRLPLHMASANGHVDIVKALVSANPDACCASDRDGMNPLHLAAVNGHFEVVNELVRAQSHAARAMVHEETILHLCVKHNQLEVLKILVDSVDDYEFVNTKDGDGNTILHLAVGDKQIETVKFLVLNTKIDANALNKNGETLMDILAQGPRDPNDQQIRSCLTRAGVVDSEELQNLQNSRSKSGFDNKHHKKPHLKRDYLTMNDDWLDKKRNTLIVVASLIATMAFQAALNPPGGVWQEDTDDKDEYGTITRENPAGSAVMLRKDQKFYHVFVGSNTVGFVSTLIVILLLISGLPCFKKKVWVWIQTVFMWLAIVSISLSYMLAILVLTPKKDRLMTFNSIIYGVVLAWVGVLTLLAVGHAIQLKKFGVCSTCARVRT